MQRFVHPTIANLLTAAVARLIRITEEITVVARAAGWFDLLAGTVQLELGLIPEVAKSMVTRIATLRFRPRAVTAEVDGTRSVWWPPRHHEVQAPEQLRILVGATKMVFDRALLTLQNLREDGDRISLGAPEQDVPLMNSCQAQALVNGRWSVPELVDQERRMWHRIGRSRRLLPRCFLPPRVRHVFGGYPESSSQHSIIFSLQPSTRSSDSI